MLNFIEIEETFCGQTDVGTYVRTVCTHVCTYVQTTDKHLRPTLLSRLRRVNLITKARFSHFLRHPAWKWSGTILVEWEGMEKQETR